MSDDLAQRIIDTIKENEGLRLNAYTCSEGKITIGYGRNLEGRGITQEEADYLFENDIERLTDSLMWCDMIQDTPEVNIVLFDMAYQMGFAGLMKFKNMLAAIKVQDYNLAAHELLDSKYARQTPERAQRNADILRGLG